MREFIQCDIDILGSESVDCEAELMTVTAQALQKIGIGAFHIAVNHRAVIRSVILFCGFTEEQVNSVCITMDKLDKIGLEGVKNELMEKGYSAEAVQSLCQVLENKIMTVDELKAYGAGEAADELFRVIEMASELSEGNYEIVFDITLVRGQGYYTGTVFEVISDEFGGTVAGGGRYDGLIGRFSGKDVPAVGFSIGFERIFSVLLAHGSLSVGSRASAAVLYNEGDFVPAYRYAETLHEEFDVTVLPAKKKLGKQFAQLEQQGYSAAFIFKGENETVERRVLNQA